MSFRNTKSYTPRKYLDDGSPNPKWKKEHHKHHKNWNPQFIGFDGEGYTDSMGSHHYNLLCCSNGNFVQDDSLSTKKCFDFLLDNSAKHHISVCYGASYDVNMMLRDVPKDKLIELWNTNETKWNDYKIRYVNRKEFSLYHYSTKRSCQLWDVIGFFQGKFVSALKDWLGEDYTDLQFITEQKDRRSQFKVDELDSIISYCQAELKALVNLMNKLKTLLQENDLHLNRWDGAGSIAACLLRKHGIKQHIGDTYHNNLEAYKAFQKAYSGGRIELLQYGYTNKRLYHYDLNSAYVGAIPELPSMLDTTWTLHQGQPTEYQRFACYHVKYECNEVTEFMPFFRRLKTGHIHYPCGVDGWYWGPEVIAVSSVRIGFEIVEWYESDAKNPAFEWVRDLYNIRRTFKQNGNPAHKVLKLGLNSLYGKFIQHVGSKINTQTLPTYHQLEWAGYITSSVRAKLFLAGISALSSIVSFQTDGIISTKPLNLPIGTDLNEWSEEPHCKAGLFVQSGVYWLWEMEGDYKGKAREFCRGFDPGSVRPSDINRAYNRGKDRVTGTSTRFITLGSALASDERFNEWRTWRPTKRELKITPEGTKRNIIDYDTDPSRQLVATTPSANKGVSYPYGLPWDSWKSSEVVDGIPIALFDSEMDDSYV